MDQLLFMLLGADIPGVAEATSAPATESYQWALAKISDLWGLFWPLFSSRSGSSGAFPTGGECKAAPTA